MFNGKPTNGRFKSESFYLQMVRSLNDAVGEYHRNRRSFTLAGEPVSSDAGV